MNDFVNIAVHAPMMGALTYAIAQDFSEPIPRGARVLVPLGKRQSSGVVLGPSKAPENTEFKIKNVLSVDANYPLLPESFLKWSQWLADYYYYPIGLVTELAYPPLENKTSTRASKRQPVIPVVASTAPPVLTDEQAKVIHDIQTYKGFSTHLVLGVTGSGKTEVYLQLLEKTLQQGQYGLMLVPEISLTPQLINRFSSRFGDKVAVIHSQLTDRERTNQWWDVIEGRKKILIGARSALFCPLSNLGLIIVDEEHEPSFKQDEKLKYHGRDAAVMLGHFSNCPVVLGSATPSLESYRNAKDGKYILHEMKNRVANRRLPDIEIIDLRQERKNELRQDLKTAMSSKTSAETKLDIPSWMTETLYENMLQTLHRKEQVALFLNRRGAAQVVLCPACGYSKECPNCDISLTLHGHHHLVCHYCDYHESFKIECPSCREGELKSIGVGTETVEREVQQLFPQAIVARADRDEIQNRMDMEELIHRMESGEINILIGTQMIAKGLDFPKLTLVGLILADIGFNLPDFRATERSYQLVTQMSGRAGRHWKEGDTLSKVLVQTYNPEHPALVYAKNNTYIEFADFELSQREPLMYPPYGRLISFRIQSLDVQKTMDAAKLLAHRAYQLRERYQNKNIGFENVEILGPVEAPIAKLRGQYRYHLLLKDQSPKTLGTFVKLLMGNEEWIPRSTRILVDVDPIHLL